VIEHVFSDGTAVVRVQSTGHTSAYTIQRLLPHLSGELADCLSRKLREP
jgi:hypothetical protein